MTTYGTAEYWKEMYEDVRDRNTRDADAEFERRERERRERHKEQEREFQSARRTASNWPEALKKQASLFQEMQDDLEREAGNYGGEVDHYFGEAAAACRRAWHVYAEELTVINPELEAIRLRIAGLEQQRRELMETVPVAVAARLETEAEGRKGWISVCKTFFHVKENEKELSEWLHW